MSEALQSALEAMPNEFFFATHKMAKAEDRGLQILRYIAIQEVCHDLAQINDTLDHPVTRYGSQTIADTAQYKFDTTKAPNDLDLMAVGTTPMETLSQSCRTYAQNNNSCFVTIGKYATPQKRLGNLDIHKRFTENNQHHIAMIIPMRAEKIYDIIKHEKKYKDYIHLSDADRACLEKMLMPEHQLRATSQFDIELTDRMRQYVEDSLKTVNQSNEEHNITPFFDSFSVEHINTLYHDALEGIRGTVRNTIRADGNTIPISLNIEISAGKPPPLFPICYTEQNKLPCLHPAEELANKFFATVKLKKADQKFLASLLDFDIRLNKIRNEGNYEKASHALQTLLCVMLPTNEEFQKNQYTFFQQDLPSLEEVKRLFNKGTVAQNYAGRYDDIEDVKKAYKNFEHCYETFKSIVTTSNRINPMSEIVTEDDHDTPPKPVPKPDYEIASQRFLAKAKTKSSSDVEVADDIFQCLQPLTSMHDGFGNEAFTTNLNARISYAKQQCLKPTPGPRQV